MKKPHSKTKFESAQPAIKGGYYVCWRSGDSRWSRTHIAISAVFKPIIPLCGKDLDLVPNIDTRYNLLNNRGICKNCLSIAKRNEIPHP